MKPNPQQQAIIDHIDGPCLVTAVPGSGKTASLTERTKNMISKGIDPSSILAITFTRKAAEEMRSRIGAAVGTEKASKMTISTFHALCARILRANAPLLGLTKSYTIYDEDDQERILKRCIAKVEDRPEERNEAGLLIRAAQPFSPSKDYIGDIMRYIEGMRNACLTPDQAQAQYELLHNQRKVADMYFDELKRSDAVDYTGLLSETIRLFTEHPEILENYRRKFRYISVDEVQDTNIAQYTLIKQLSSGHKNIMMVGDLDQSIYRFRNASPENLLQFEKEFGAKLLKLEVNYRSTPEILKYAHELIQRNKMRKDTELKTSNPSGDIPKIVGFKTDEDMALWIAKEARALILQGVPPSQIAIFYRVNSASRVLEMKMRELSLKYKVLGGLDFFSRKEIKACMAILKLLCNASDVASFEKACEHCCKGVGTKTVSTIIDHGSDTKIPIMDAAKAYVRTGTQPAKGLAPFVNALEAARQMPADKGLMKVARSTAFWDKMRDDSTTTNDRCGNIEEMARDVGKFLANGGTLIGYLQNITLLTAADEGTDSTQIKLMSMHACKGLEFDHVFVSHVNSTLIPHARTMGLPEGEERSIQIEEERRLLYVAMTRAKKRLRMCFCRAGMNKMMDPSPFLYETGLHVPQVEPPKT
jgi:DNA helicase II / ATP-dependent DNA helicase PcrA